ncbi:MAG: hypothetical protein K0B10_12185 [Vicingaceae bacterium]|nr:hypothetical protein [Vicingaceae bacterium]
MKSILSILIVSFLLLSITFNSCRKKEPAIDLTTNSTQDNTVAENLFEDIRKVVVEVIDDEGASMRVKSGFSFGNCATVNINPSWVDTIWPKVITIDFGSTNCIGTDGVKRRGKIIVTFSDLYKNPGSVLNVQLQNYYVNEHLIEGSKTITNNGRNSSNNLSFTVNVTNGKITYPNNGGVTTWSSVRTNEWVAGESTNLFTHGIAGICDDVYLITGNANGINRFGKAYTMQITNPLRKEICCRWLVSGTINITPSGLPTRILDFGTGACDNNASITIGSNTFNFMMY